MSNYRFAILLSASVPSTSRDRKYLENYTRIKNAPIQIEEAVIGLARNVFQAGGKIVFGGHPSISPLIEMIASEFETNKEIENTGRNERGEKPIHIFQSKAYEKVITKEAINLFNLGYSDITWTDNVDGEECDPEIQNMAQCEKSLDFMRRDMMRRKIDALVCIGGMEGVEKEFDLFRELHPSQRIFILKKTGGASKLLAEKYSDSDFVKVIDDIDDQKLMRAQKKEDNRAEIFDIIPFSFYTALIVKEILDAKSDTNNK